MKELIRQQEQCEIYARDAATSLSNFFQSNGTGGLFYVSYSNEKGFGTGSFEPNAATSIVCGVFASLNAERARVLCEDKQWDPLVGQVKTATNTVIKSDLSKSLPLLSMGKLPIHSVAHLTHLCLHYETIKEPADRSIFDEDVLAICVRRLIFAIEADLRSDNGSSRERLHPYLLYVSTRALRKVCRKLKSEDGRSYLEGFVAKLGSCETGLIEAIKEKYATTGKTLNNTEAKADLGFDLDNFGVTIDATFLDVYLPQLFSRVKDRNVVQAQAQIAHYVSSVSADFDPSSLAFAIATLSDLKTSRYRHVVHQGLDLLQKVFEEDKFASSVPFMVDDKGRATFVPSVETANILLKICEEQLKDSRSSELCRVVEVAQRFQRRLEETKQIAAKDGKAIKGWCNDKAPSKGRVDSWVTAYAMEFFYRTYEIIKLEKRRSVFEDYSWTSYEKCNPEWPEIIDPDIRTTDGTITEPIKGKIMSLIGSTEKNRRAPVFLLYGPPGTSKTSFVKGVAQKKKWDLISLSPSDFISDSVDRIEHRARKIFHDLMNIDECVILFDEMDSLLLDRDRKEVKDDSVLKFIVPAFLPKLQELHDYVAKKQMAVFFVTNYGERIDSAIKRKGRIDEKLLIPPYNAEAREKLLLSLLRKERKFLPEEIDHVESKEAVNKALGMMSTLSVFRDVMEFAYCFERESAKLIFSEEKAITVYSEGISIPAQTYDVERKGADEEFQKILARIAGRDIPNRTTWHGVKEQAKSALKSDKDFAQWHGVITSRLPEN